MANNNLEANRLEHMSIAEAEKLGTKKVNELLRMANLTKKDDDGIITEEAKTVNNTITALSETIDTYGIRQEIVIKTSDEDPVVTARRKLNDNCTPTEEIQVECIGDINYKVGYGVHVVLPFLPDYSDCLMYIKEVTNEWKSNGSFISTLTLTPSRVMDIQEWIEDSEDENSSSSSSSSELADKIIALLKQQVGIDYAWGGKSPETGFDCSGLIYYCYNQFKDELGITLGGSTYEQVKQGTEVDKNEKSLWEVGDLLFWIGEDTPPSHVSVYLGNNQMIHAPSSGKTVEIVDITRTDIYAVRRVIPEDLNSNMKVYGTESIPEDYVSHLSSVSGNCNTFITNMNKYGYKDYIISVSKEKSVDPYITSAIIAIESEGNPKCGSTYYGLMQVAGGSSDPKTNIGQGLDVFNNKKAVVGEQMHVILSAYNSGEGTVTSAAKAKGLSLASCSIKELGDALYDYVSSHYSSWSPEEKKYYSSKVLKAYSILKSKNALN